MKLKPTALAGAARKALRIAFVPNDRALGALIRSPAGRQSSCRAC